MSSGQWEALPQRRRKRRPAAVGSSAATPADIPPHPPRQQQHGFTSAQAPAPPSGETGAPATAGRTGGSASESRRSPDSADLAGSSSSQQHRGGKQQPCGRGAPSDGVGGGAPPPSDGDRAERAAGSGGTGGLVGSVPASATTPPPPPAAPAARGAAPAAGGAGETTQRGGEADGEGDEGGQGRRGYGGNVPDAEAVAARHAAVATAVEARSQMTRFAGGLEGGAGADGGSAGANFEYLDHTADVQLHSWGDSIERAMEGALAAMFNTITDIAKVDVDPSLTRAMEIEGHDAKSLLFSLLDEFLFLFHAEGLAVKRTTVNGTIRRDNGPSPRWRLKATAEGETFDLSKHPQGTEVKAITYSNMQINEAPDGRTDIYVIVDI